MTGLGLEQQPLWLEQVHGTQVLYAPEAGPEPRADASFSDQPGPACVVMTADCLPVLFCDRQGTQVAAAHAGWRGLCQGILRKTLARFSRPDQVMAYLGPAIGPDKFEVGDEVLQAFIHGAQNGQQMEAIQTAFMPTQQGKYLADLYALARAELTGCGLGAIYGGDFCTFTDAERFYSYRRELDTGRMASLIWLKNNQ
jgi:YfiH family protein